MKFEIHCHHHYDDPLNLGLNIMTILDNLKAQVEANNTVVQSAVTLLNGLKAKLDEAMGSTDPTALQALSDHLAQETAALAAAVSANTPSVQAAPVPQPTPVATDPVPSAPVDPTPTVAVDQNGTPIVP